MILADLGFGDLAKKYLESILACCDLDRANMKLINSRSSRLTVPEMCESAEAFAAALVTFEQRLYQTVPDDSAEKHLNFTEAAEPSSPQFQAPLPPMSPTENGDTSGILSAPSNESDVSFMTAATSIKPNASQPKNKDRVSAKVTAKKLARVKRKEKKIETLREEEANNDGVAAALIAPPPNAESDVAHPTSAPPSQLNTPLEAKPQAMPTPSDSRKPSSKPGSKTSETMKKPDAPKSAPAAIQSKLFLIL